MKSTLPLATSSAWVTQHRRERDWRQGRAADFVGVGDQVTVNYRKAGSGLHADEVRVRSKVPKK